MVGESVPIRYLEHLIYNEARENILIEIGILISSIRNSINENLVKKPRIHRRNLIWVTHIKFMLLVPKVKHRRFSRLSNVSKVINMLPKLNTIFFAELKRNLCEGYRWCNQHAHPQNWTFQ